MTNRFTYFLGEEYTKRLIPFFRFHPPGYYFKFAYKKHFWDGYTSLLVPMKNGSRVPTGLFLAKREEIKRKLKCKFIRSDKRRAPEFRTAVLSNRAYQDTAVQALIQNSNCGGIITSATGTGKTYMAGLYFKALIGYGLFVVDELTLLDQARRELSKVTGEEVGYIGDMKFKPKRITVATVQTLHLHRNDPKFRPWMKRLQVMLIDELHTMLNRRNRETVLSIQPLAVFGLTATLQTKKKEIAYKAFSLCGPIIYTYPIAQATEEKNLSPGIAIEVYLKRRKKGEGYQDEYGRMVVSSQMFNDIIEKIAREGVKRKKPTLVIVERIKHIYNLSRRLKDVRHVTVHGGFLGKNMRQRREIIERVESGKLKLVITNRVFKKGVNIKRLAAMVDGAASRNPDDVMQKYGRMARLHGSKAGFVFFHVGDRGVEEEGLNTKERNRFAKNARKRNKELKRNKVTTYSFRWNGSAKSIWNKAERLLATEVKKFK